MKILSLYLTPSLVGENNKICSVNGTVKCGNQSTSFILNPDNKSEVISALLSQIGLSGLFNGNIYLDNGFTKIIIDADAENDIRDFWLEYIPFINNNTTVFEVQIDSYIGCKYPFPISVSNQSSNNYTNTDNAADTVTFEINNRCSFNIKQNSDKYLNVTLVNGNELRNIDTSTVSTSIKGSEFYFKGNLGIHNKTAYIDGDFLSGNVKQFGLYFEE